jgi:acyl-coenzyme A synthetase/AMP-(fatty) acid ligase
MNLIDKFLQVVKRNPAAPALIYQGEVWTRARFHRLVCHAAIRLQAQGVVPGDVVGMSMDQSPLHLAAMLALARLGAVSLPVHPQLNPQGQQRLMAQFGARKLLGLSGGPALEGFTFLELGDVGAHNLPERDLNFTDYWPAPEAPGRLALTSGTTGVAGGILYSHERWLHRIETTVEYCDETTRLMPSNLHLTMGNLAAMAAVLAGGVLVFHTLHDRASFYATVAQYGITHTLMPPALIAELAELNGDEGFAFPSLKFLRIVGGGLTPQMIALAKSKLTPHVYLPYGISEVGAISIASPELLESHPSYAGRLKPGVALEAINPEGQVLPAGEIGELRVRVPGMPSAYYLNEERTAQRFREGWFYTGDVGFVTAQGLVSIEGRLDDRINLGGTKFYPESIEGVLNSHPEVNESAVFVLHDKEENPMLVALVVAKHPGPLNHKLVDFLRLRKLGAKTPQRFFLVKELPKNPTGKIMRHELVALVNRMRDSQPA